MTFIVFINKGRKNRRFVLKEGLKGNLGSLYIKKMDAIKINIITYGRRNKNHETDSYPFLQSKFRIHVQNRT
jgi:hypothetical protein